MSSESQISITDKIIATTNTFRGKTAGEMQEELTSLINELINSDFNALVHLLYRIDVNEEKLKQLLHQPEGSDAASIIAGLIIKRQLEKIAAKEQFNNSEESGTGGSW